MSNVLFYSICRYIPDTLRDEFVNVGIVIHIPGEKRSIFKQTKNLTRIKAFDDEVEMDVLKAILETLKMQLTLTALDSSEEHISKTNDLFLKTKLVYYVNQIQFSEIRALTSTNLNDDINDLFDTYLYYDKKKSNRITADRVRSLTSKIFKQSDFNKAYVRNPNYKNIFKQQPFDFSINLSGNDETLIKALSFDYQNPNRFINEVKSILFDIQEAKKVGYLDIKVVINNTDLGTETEDLIFNVLSKEIGIDVLTLEQFDKFLHSPNTTGYKQLSFLD